MIKIEEVMTEGWKPAFRGMRNPMDSWAQADSAYECVFKDVPWPSGDKCACEGYFDEKAPCYMPDTSRFIIGPNDMKLAAKLAKLGGPHAKFLRQIQISMDITAPLYWWKEFDTYKVGTVANSCSTMHKIHSKEFAIDQFSCDHLVSPNWSEADNFGYSLPSTILNETIGELNECRELYLKAKKNGDEPRAKMFWWQLIQLLPSSYNQKRTVTFNYQTAQEMHKWRHEHKLDEWRIFCRELEKLPYAKELILCYKERKE